MQAEEYRRMYELENQYWWFVARRRLALRLLKKALREFSKPKILDLGCGTGAVLKELTGFSWPIGVDMSPIALSFCQSRQLCDLIVGRGEKLPIRSESVDAVIALDVFEHIDDDLGAMRESARILKPGGALVLSVPAFMSLWGPHDVALMHFRRYRRPEIKARLEEAGFQVERLSYAIFTLFPLVATIRFFEKRKTGEPKASLPALPNWMNRGLIGLQGLESGAISGFALPWGSSVVAVARKP